MSKRRAYILVMILAFVLAVTTGGDFPYLILIMLSVNLLIMKMMIERNAKSLYHLFYIDQEKCTSGEEVVVDYKLTNMSVVPIPFSNVKCIVSKKLGLMDMESEYCFFKPTQMINLKRTMRCEHKGYYTVGRLEIKLSDPFDIIKKVIRFDKEINLTVYPKIHHIDYLPIPSQEPMGRSKSSDSFYEDYTNFSGVRDFIEGDNPKKIHWKLSSKVDRLMIKKFDLSANIKLNILVNGFWREDREVDLEVEDGLAEIAISVVNYCLRNNFNTTMISNTKNRSELTALSMDKFGLFLEEATGFELNSDVSYDLFVQSETRKLYFGSTVVCVTHCLDDALVAVLIGAKSRKINLILMLFMDRSKVNVDLEERVDYLKTLNVNVYVIHDRDSIGHVLGA